MYPCSSTDENDVKIRSERDWEAQTNLSTVRSHNIKLLKRNKKKINVM